MSEDQVTVNVAEWDGPDLGTFPPGWAIVNAPRPIAGARTWMGAFRHGTFYAASFDGPASRESWRRDDAWPVVFTTNAAIEAAVQAKLDERGMTLEDTCCTMAELAQSLGFPYLETSDDETPSDAPGYVGNVCPLCRKIARCGKGGHDAGCEYGTTLSLVTAPVEPSQRILENCPVSIGQPDATPTKFVLVSETNSHEEPNMTSTIELDAQAFAAIQEHGNARKASKATGIAANTLRDRAKRHEQRIAQDADAGEIATGETAETASDEPQADAETVTDDEPVTDEQAASEDETGSDEPATDEPTDPQASDDEPVSDEQGSDEPQADAEPATPKVRKGDERYPDGVVNLNRYTTMLVEAGVLKPAKNVRTVYQWAAKAPGNGFPVKHYAADGTAHDEAGDGTRPGVTIEAADEWVKNRPARASRKAGPVLFTDEGTPNTQLQGLIEGFTAPTGDEIASLFATYAGTTDDATLAGFAAYVTGLHETAAPAA